MRWDPLELAQVRWDSLGSAVFACVGWDSPGFLGIRYVFLVFAQNSWNALVFMGIAGMRWSSSEIRWEAQAFVGIRKVWLEWLGLVGPLDSLAFAGIR